MSFSLLILCLCLLGSGGLAIGSTLVSIISWLLLIIALVFIWEYKVYVFLFFVSIIALLFIKLIISDYLKYKDETQEERKERLKTSKMTEEWRKRNNF